MLPLWSERSLEKGMPLLPEEKGRHVLFTLFDSCLVVDSTNSWWIDSEVTNYVFNSLQGFQLRTRLNEGDMYLTLTLDVRIVV